MNLMQMQNIPAMGSSDANPLDRGNSSNEAANLALINPILAMFQHSLYSPWPRPACKASSLAQDCQHNSSWLTPPYSCRAPEHQKDQYETHSTTGMLGPQ